jgi:mono/diheme cytochrome c family protein
MDRIPRYKEEIDFRELLRSPRRLFGYSYVYFLKLLLLLGILYAWHVTDIGKNAIMPVALKDSSAFVQDIPFQAPSVLPPVDVRRAAVPTDSVLRIGRELFRANCASCHGDNGLGDGPAGLVLTPKPRNFHLATGWTNGARVTDIYRTLQEGIVRNGMASYNYLPPGDRFALIHFVRSFHPAPPADAEADVLMLETTYQLSKGSSIPAQIPIRNAMQRVVAENGPRIQAVAATVSRVMADVSTPGAALLRRVMADPAKAVTSLRSVAPAAGTVEQFIRRVSADPGMLGLKPSVTRLRADEWLTLHHYVTTGGL